VGRRRAVQYFIDQAVLAAANSDELSERTWRDIAQAAREMDAEGWRA
jgi:hypothetical protein